MDKCKWVKTEECYYYYYFYTECGHKWNYLPDDPYTECPHCGRKIELEEE